MSTVKTFFEITKADAATAGGKGASLGEMTRAGIPVPPGYVILASAFDRFLEITNLSAEIDAILKTVHVEDTKSIDEASIQIQQLILSKEIPEAIHSEILKNFKILNASFVAVRSSATAEDSASAAWAGQLDTFLNTTEATLFENVRKCWASLFTPRAIFYRFEKGLNDSHISVAVVVQAMVNSEISGIAFSVHPVTEDRNQMIIEAGWGLGEAVVSGQITPDSYVVTKVPRQIVETNVVEQEKTLMRMTGSAGGNEWVSVPAEKTAAQKLSEVQILELSEQIINIEKHYGFPIDAEWAYEAGKFYVTQSRPITTLSGTAEK